jgi:squalene-hopene/tetraprenyl-beta-curcumene cyclase
LQGFVPRGEPVPDYLSEPTNAAPAVFAKSLEETIISGRDDLKRSQAEDGHWVFELEADATISAEYILLGHYLDEIDTDAEPKLAAYLRKTQADHGGWPLFKGGDFDMSASVKAYFALKLAGDGPDLPHMKKARDAILAHGGAARSNVFTRITLALFGQVPWRAVPVMPLGIMLLPRWFPFHLDKVSYWSRTVIVPLLVLLWQKPSAKNPRGIDIRELFVTPPEQERDYLVNPTGARLGKAFLALDHALRFSVPRFFPKKSEKRALDAAITFIRERANGVHGLGGIFPAMANMVMAFHALGVADDDPDLVAAKQAIRGLLVDQGDIAHCQPCLSPIWDTALVMHALMEAGEPGDSPTMQAATNWLIDRQITDKKGDWSVNRPALRPGGWAFEYANDHYPDTDDTAAVGLALQRADSTASRNAVERAAEWIAGMQSSNGGWGSFDADNTHTYLNHIPFADHGALLDPPTSDVTARCLGFLVQSGYAPKDEIVRRGIQFLRDEQEEDGSWFGRWGTNYIYGTWSVLSALNAVGEDPKLPYIRRAVEWLKERQNPDGGWGESCASYWSETRELPFESTPTQTAWALLALMAAGEVESEAVRRGIEWLLEAPRDGVEWDEVPFNAVGFPRVFYLKYHGYNRYFPLWALARYHRLHSGNSKRTPHGI